MLKIEYSMMIARPIDQVWGFVTDFEKSAKSASISGTEVRQTSTGPTGVGSTFRLTSRFLWRSRSYDLRISEWEPGKKVLLVGDLGPLKQVSSEFRFESAEGKTRFTRRLQGELHGLWKLLQPILAWRANRSNGKTMANLKQLLESQVEV